jgi:hypothetical protein
VNQFTDLGLVLQDTRRLTTRVQYFGFVYTIHDLFTGPAGLYESVVNHLVGGDYHKTRGIWIGDCGAERVFLRRGGGRLMLVRTTWDREKATIGRQVDAFTYLHDPTKHYFPNTASIVCNRIDHVAKKIEEEWRRKVDQEIHLDVAFGNPPRCDHPVTSKADRSGGCGPGRES